MIFLFLWLNSLSILIFRSNRVATNGIVSFYNLHSLHSTHQLQLLSTSQYIWRSSGKTMQTLTDVGLRESKRTLGSELTDP